MHGIDRPCAIISHNNILYIYIYQMGWDGDVMRKHDEDWANLYYRDQCLFRVCLAFILYYRCDMARTQYTLIFTL